MRTTAPTDSAAEVHTSRRCNWDVDFVFYLFLFVWPVKFCLFLFRAG